MNKNTDVNMLSRQGEQHFKQQAYKSALTAFLKVLPASPTEVYTQNVASICRAYERVGQCYYYLQQAELSLNYLVAAKQYLHLLNTSDPVHVSILLDIDINTGVFLFAQEDYMAALQQFLTAINRPVNKNEQYQIYILNNIAQIYQTLGNYQQALDNFKQALQVYVQGELAEQATQPLSIIYLNIGICYYQLANYGNALIHFNKAISTHYKISSHNKQNSIYEVKMYNNIASCYNKLRQFNDALQEYQKAQRILEQQTITQSTQKMLAQNYNNQASCLELSEQLEQAIVFYQKAITISDAYQLSDVDKFYHNIAACYRKNKQVQQALLYHEKAIAISTQKYTKSNPSLALRYQTYAQTLRIQGQYVAALQQINQAVENLFTSPNDAARLNFDNCLSKSYLINALKEKAYILQKIASKQPRNATDLLKKALNIYRKISFFDSQIRATQHFTASQLKNAFVLSNAYGNAVAAAYQLYQVTQQSSYIQLALEYAEKDKAMLLLSGLKDAKAKLKSTIPQKLITQLYGLQKNINKLQKQLLAERQLTAPKQSKINAWQDELFDVEIQRIKLIKHLENEYPEYKKLKFKQQPVSIADYQSLLSTNSVCVQFHINEGILYSFIIAKKCHTLSASPLPSNFTTLCQQYLKSITTVNPKQYVTIAHQLFNILLNNNLDWVQQHCPSLPKHLLIVPHKVLQKLPFECLLIHPYQGKIRHLQCKDLHYLIKQYAITYHYSINLQYFIYQRKQSTSITSPRQTFTAFAPSNFYGQYANLPQSLSEVQTVAKHFKQSGYQVKLFTQQAATVKQFIQSSIQCQYLLVSTHGIVNQVQEALSGLVFSKSQITNANTTSLSNTSTPDSSSCDMLYLSDVYQLNVQANLVMLSACQSGQGKIAEGEGIMGINRAFMYAGANNILFTLINIPDQQQLIAYFTQHLLQRPKQLAEALQAAKQQIIQNNVFPNAWAGFVLMAEA